MQTLAIIPARGGSKGIPRKNILDINGKPLIAYSIEVALEAKKKGVISEVIVSTDDLEIAKIAESLGAYVPFIRPESLSNDSAKSVDLMIHAYQFFLAKGIQYDTLVLLQPTTPLRTFEDIKNSIDIYKHSSSSSLITCYKEEYVCDLVSYHKDGHIAIPLNKNHNKGIRRQELQDLYVRNGAIYIVDSSYILETHQVISDTPAMYVMPKNSSVNIDCLDDVEILRWKTQNH